MSSSLEMTQQYPVAPPPGFHTRPEPRCGYMYAGVFYPVPQPPQQQALLPLRRRESKQITIQDPNHGGRDITVEIMSGSRTTSPPTPPHAVGSEVSGSVQNVMPAAAVPPLDECASAPVALASDLQSIRAVPVPPGPSQDPALDAPPSAPPASPEPTKDDAPVPPQTTPLKEAEPNTAPGELTCAEGEKAEPETELDKNPEPRRSQQGQCKESRKILPSIPQNKDMQLNKAKKAWKPAVKKSHGEEEDPEAVKTEELFRRVRSILNKLTLQKFQQLMKQVTKLTIDTEERLRGVMELIFEKAISKPSFYVGCANMCSYLKALVVPTSDKPEATVNFRILLLRHCQKEFEKNIDEQKQKKEEDGQHLNEDLEEEKDKARCHSLGNIKFICELFKQKMLKEKVMHGWITKLLENPSKESLECLCCLMSTIGKDLDLEKAKPRMDLYFHLMEKIIKERKTSSRLCFMLQDGLDLRQNNWVPKRGTQGPKTINKIHKEATMEEHKEQVKVQQQLQSKNNSCRGRGGRMSQPQSEGRKTVLIRTKKLPIGTSCLNEIIKTLFYLFVCFFIFPSLIVAFCFILL